ncbi:unnamed protein product, partial [Brassica oleracea var. botrytis]
MMEPPTVVAAVSDQSEAITEPAVVSFPPPLESDSQAVVDYITDSLLPLSESVIPPPTTLVTNELEIPHDQPFIFSSIPSFPITSNPPLLPVHTLSSSTPPPSPPSSTALLSPTIISFASDLALASVVEQNLLSLMQKLCPGWSFASNHHDLNSSMVCFYSVISLLSAAN